MKKALVLLIAIVYSFMAMGIAVNFHYCSGKLASVNIHWNFSEACGCGSQKKHPCCKDEVKLYKIDDQQQKVSDLIHFSVAQSPVHHLVSDKSHYALSTHNCFKGSYHSPPPVAPRKIYLSNRVFRI